MNTPRRRRPIYPPLPTTPFDDDDIAEADIICPGSASDMVKARVLTKAERYLRGYEGLYIHSATLRGPVVTNPWSRKRKAAEVDAAAAAGSKVETAGRKMEEDHTTTKISSFYSARKNAPASSSSTTAMLKLHKKPTRNNDDFTMGDTNTNHRPRRSHHHPRPEESDSPVGVEVSVRWVSRRESAAGSPSEVRSGSPNRRGMKQQQQEEEDILDTITVSQSIPPAEEEEVLDTITVATPEPPQNNAAEEEILDTIVVTPPPPPVIVKKARRVKIDFETISPAVVKPPKKKRKVHQVKQQPGPKTLHTTAAPGNIMKETSDSTSNVQATGPPRAVGTNEENPTQAETVSPDDLQNKVPTENTTADRVRHYEEEATKLSIQKHNDNRLNNLLPHINATSGENNPPEHDDDKSTTDKPTATNMVSLIAEQRSEPNNHNYAFSGKPSTNDVPLEVMQERKTPRSITAATTEPPPPLPEVTPWKGTQAQLAAAQDGFFNAKDVSLKAMQERRTPRSITAATAEPPPPLPEVTPWKGTQAQLAAAQDGFFNAMAESPICFDTLQTPAAAHHPSTQTTDQSTIRPASAQTQQRQSMLWDEWPVPLYSSPVPQEPKSPPPPPPPPKIDYTGPSGPYTGRYGQLTPFSAFYSPSPSRSPSPQPPSTTKKLRFSDEDNSQPAAQPPSSTTTKKLRFSDEDNAEVEFAGKQVDEKEEEEEDYTPSSGSKRNSDDATIPDDDGIQYMLDITQPWEIDEELRKLAGTSTPVPPKKKKKRQTGGGGGARGSLLMG
jgi:hypothetical protein